MSTDRVVHWQGGSLDELVGMLAGPALAARIEVVIPDPQGRPERVIGEVHLVAGGVAEAISGSLRGDDAMAQLQGLPMAHFRVEPCVPNPENGSVSPPGPEEGSLADRPLAALMRYCEEYAMTCLLEVWRGGQQATINYRRGEIVSTNVDGSDAAEQLPEVMTWSEGQYRIVLPPLVLPAPPRPARPVVPAARPSASVEQRTLFGYVPPDPVPAADPPHRSQESILRETIPFVPQRAEVLGDGHRPTRPGLPVDIYDAAMPERVTDVGVPAMPSVDPDKTPLPAPSEPRLPASVPSTLPDRGPPQSRATAPGFVPSTPESVPTLTGQARESRAAIASPRAPSRRVAVRRRTLSDLPVIVHVGLGLALGLAIVGAYWVAQSLLPH